MEIVYKRNIEKVRSDELIFILSLENWVLKKQNTCYKIFRLSDFKNGSGANADTTFKSSVKVVCSSRNLKIKYAGQFEYISVNNFSPR